ncbi:MAG: NTP transferase domain-containing protein, partial [Lachnospiraceae bacterium]|nr:NTP transferase domain-containing protein [Lachnospiraceae bacterium]
MKAILLAAGVGTRIVKDIGPMPKSMLEVDGQPLIVHTVQLLQKNNMEVTVITGFQHRVIEEALKDLGVTIYYNPFYAVTNSIGSLWYAREELNTDEVFIANADVFYTQEMLDIVFAAKRSVFLLSDETRADQGDYFFLTSDGILEKYG